MYLSSMLTLHVCCKYLSPWNLHYSLVHFSYLSEVVTPWCLWRALFFCITFLTALNQEDQGNWTLCVPASKFLNLPTNSSKQSTQRVEETVKAVKCIWKLLFFSPALSTSVGNYPNNTEQKSLAGLKTFLTVWGQSLFGFFSFTEVKDSMRLLSMLVTNFSSLTPQFIVRSKRRSLKKGSITCIGEKDLFFIPFVYNNPSDYWHYVRFLFFLSLHNFDWYNNCKVHSKRK